MNISQLNHYKFFDIGSPITYSFYTNFAPLPADYDPSDPSGLNYFAGNYLYTSRSSFSGSQQTWMTGIVTQVQEFTDLTFGEVQNNSGTMLFGNASLYKGPDPSDPSKTAWILGAAPGLIVPDLGLPVTDDRVGDVWLYEDTWINDHLSDKDFRETAYTKWATLLASHTHSATLSRLGSVRTNSPSNSL